MHISYEIYMKNAKYIFELIIFLLVFIPCVRYIEYTELLAKTCSFARQ